MSENDRNNETYITPEPSTAGFPTVAREAVDALLLRLSKDNKRVFWGERHGNGMIPATLARLGPLLRTQNNVTTAFIEHDAYMVAAAGGGPFCGDDFFRGNRTKPRFPVTGTQFISFDEHINQAHYAGMRVIGDDDVRRLGKPINSQSYNNDIVWSGTAYDRRDSFAMQVIQSTDDSNHAIIIGGVDHGKSKPSQGRPSNQALAERLNIPSVAFHLFSRDDPRAGFTKECSIALDSSGDVATYRVLTNNPFCLGSIYSTSRAQYSAAAQMWEKIKKTDICGEQEGLKNAPPILSHDLLLQFVAKHYTGPDAPIKAYSPPALPATLPSAKQPKAKTSQHP